MKMTAIIPKMRARGSVRRGSFTSPPTKLRSAQPSNAHSTDTSANPNAAMAKLPAGVPGVKLSPPVCGSPRASATMTMNISPPYFATVVMFCTADP